MLHRRRIESGEWTPADIEALEDNALVVVHSDDNRSVIAGPGAGKTELLAQRAAFLLQTGRAPYPRRILAISFKRDAATNLAARVRKRCHPDHARRFDSMTFDAFAKGLVDRFGQALPTQWRPSPDYRISFPGERIYRAFLDEVGSPPRSIGTRADIEAIGTREFEREYLFGDRLRDTPPAHPTPGEWAAQQYWNQMLHGTRGSVLTFPMISRLAELLVHVNPMVRRAVTLTYSHLFLDEFQDTTHIQYDLVTTIFLGSSSVVTAVGDNKQQIMRWAMAMEDPFTRFEHDFSAKRTPLLNNYRSSPELVRIQYVLAQALDKQSVEAVSKVPGTIARDSCQIWDFSTPESEAAKLAEFVEAEMNDHKLGPRDVVFLVRQRAADYVMLLSPALAERGILLRNEAAEIGPVRLQELLSEELSEFVILFLRLAASTRAGRLWSECLERMATLRGLASDDEVSRGRLARQIDESVDACKAKFPTPVMDAPSARAIVDDVLTFVTRADLTAAHPAYRQGDWLDAVSGAVAQHLLDSCSSQTGWSAALDVYEGLQAVPLMTIHKSKGLEYHTMIFVGLDDEAWWSFSRDESEATSGFFVAFTRAKQRVIFTYCPSRGDRRKIAALYQLLRSAGVPVVEAGWNNDQSARSPDH